ncbi:hypothetical protein FSP39_001860 [Pinctada imbricata]|uniref:G-protein coupled receptors family 3 profile domain-containing protein n=1 Tax=Pinctada imbricata TaxID=66713 RepID=A0AA88XIY3_PINIB|nr:hypothetical protein FSP39_001860 [Pinctada imbricata]
MAFFYAINLVNSNSDLKLPASLKLGGMALDACSTPSRIGQDMYSLLSGESICGSQTTGQVIDPSTIVVHLTKNSANSIVTSTILSPLKITTLSQSATSVELSDKNYHSYFLRTVPPDNIQAVVMAEVVQRFGWDYVSIVYTNDAYGRAAKDTFLANTENSSPRTCTAITVSMAADASLDDFRNALDDLNQRVGARVVILFLTTDHVQKILQATKDKGLQNRFIWFGSDTWSNSQLVVQGVEDAATGALTIQIKSEIVENFKNYVKTLTFNNRHGLPNDWFEDIYQTLHQCRILNSVVRKPFTRICSEKEMITDAMIPQDPFVLHTIISVFMVAQGLNQIEVCKSSSLDIAACLSLQDNKLDLIYNGILESQYNVLPEALGNKSFQFRFTESGYGDIGYNILNFRRDLTSGSGEFQYVPIGTYQTSLELDRSLYQGFSFVDTRSVPNSQCPVGSTCRCLNRNGSYETYSRQGISGLSGVPSKEVVPLFWVICWQFGVVLVYAMVFAFIVHATEEVCGLRRFCLGFVYAICYSALFVKLVDCWRTKEKEDIYNVKYEKLGKPLGLFFVAVLLVLVQCIINAEWLILENPQMERILYNNMLWPRCMPNDFYDEGLILSLVYIMFIIFLSVVVGLMTWRSKKNHREARWILGIFVLSIPVWVVFCIVACMGAYKMRDAAIAIGLLINATIMFVLGPMRKLYLLNKFEAKMEEEERKSIVTGSQKGEGEWEGFEDKRLTQSQNYWNTKWFSEFRDQKHGCNVLTNPCNTSLTLRGRYERDPFVPFTLAAVRAAIIGIQDGANTHCNTKDLCSSYLNNINRGQYINDGIINAQLGNKRFFDNSGDASVDLTKYCRLPGGWRCWADDRIRTGM